MSRTETATRSAGFRASLYLQRLEWHLEGMVPGAERKRIIRTLREEIDADMRSLDAVLEDLGSPRTLAARYAEGGTPRPLWSIGALIAGAALLTYWIIFGLFVGGMLAAVDSAAPMSADAVFLFVPVTAFSDDDSFGIGWSGGWAWLAVPAVITFLSLLVGARAWRFFRRDGLRAA